MEYIWSLEEELEDSEDLVFAASGESDDESDWYNKMCREGGFFWDSPEQWFMQMVEYHAMELWQGEQVDGSTFNPQTAAKVPLDKITFGCDWPGAKYFIDRAVMAGYRYLVSFRSTPRHMRVNGYVRP